MSDYLRFTQQEALSAGLEELGLYYAHRLSFQEVAGLVERVCGQPLICEQTLWNWAQRKAAQRDAPLAAEVAACQELPFPPLSETVESMMLRPKRSWR